MPQETQNPRLEVDGRCSQVALLGDGPWFVGRSLEADVTFPDDPYCSKDHFRIQREGGTYRLVPLSKRAPTFVNGAKADGVTTLKFGDEVTFGTQRVTFTQGISPEQQQLSSPEGIRVADNLLLGRSAESGHVQLDHPVVSRRHAQLEVDGSSVFIRDLRSTNGTFLNGLQVSGRAKLSPGDLVVIGPFDILFTGSHLHVTNRTGNVQLIGRSLSRVVRTTGRRGRPLKILTDANVLIKPREFVAIIGPSGSGKSTLMHALSGRLPATTGDVLINYTSLYKNFDAIKRDIAMVPQYNVLHEELTLRQALGYTGRLRLPRDLKESQRQKLIEDVARSVDLEHRLDATIKSLSGGQRRRASLANETLSRPGVLFLDEVTSGLDESTDRDIMMLLRRLASEGMTIICVTHTLVNIEEFCHRLIVMGDNGVLVFSGSPSDARTFFDVSQLSHVFDRISGDGTKLHREHFEHSTNRLEETRIIGAAGGPSRAGVEEEIRRMERGEPEKRLVEFLRQFPILLARDLRLLVADVRSLGIALVQSVVIGLLLGITFQQLGDPVQAVSSGSSIILLLGLSALWLGCNSGSKAIVGDKPVFMQESAINLSPLSFVLSKFVVYSLTSVFQVSVVLVLTSALAAEVPGGALNQFPILTMGALAGTALGLLISAASDTRDQATTLVPLALVPQFILSSVIAPAMSSFMQKIAEFFVTGYWIVEAMMAVRMEREGPTLLPTAGPGGSTEMVAVASSDIGMLCIVAHTTIFVGIAYWLTYRTSKRNTLGNRIPR